MDRLKKLPKQTNAKESPSSANTSVPLSESVYQSSDIAGTIAALTLDPCSPCTKKKSGKVLTAKWFCSECQEVMCEDCKSAHNSFKPTQNHDVKSLHPPCGPCQVRKIKSGSNYYCENCNEHLCEDCKSYHSTLKVLQDHRIKTNKERIVKGQGIRTVKPGPQEPTNQRPLQQQRRVQTPKCLKKFYAQATGDAQTPYISGSAFLPDSGKLLLVDKYNRKLKLYDNFRFVTQQQFKGWPQKVAAYDSSEVAVTVGLDVFRFSVEGTDGAEIFKEKQKHSLGFYCYGLAYISSDMLAVTGEEKDEGIFCVYNTEGKQLSKLSLGKKQIPYDVTLGGGRSIAYVCTGKEGKVTAIDIGSNKVLFAYNHREVSDPSDITVDMASTIYVCGGDSCKIHEISPDGKTSQVLLAKEDGLGYPRTMSFAPNWDTFIVGGDEIDGADNHVQVYEM